ncbi:MAG: hypothetical protein PHE61_00825 [Candidatus Omnitrophica bacterium]|nr:hypothetical protein [Candidatus Omnitrophota bacterium]
MEEIQKLLGKLHSIIESDSKYKLEAYTFILGALEDTMRRLDKPRHVTGKELCEGIRRYGLEQFGPLARTVFEHWGVRETMDFGHIVFSLVDAGLMSKNENDSINDFKDIFSFDEAFDRERYLDSKD